MKRTSIIPIKVIDDGFNGYGTEPVGLLRLLNNEIKQTKNGDYINLHQWFRVYGKKEVINTIKLMQQAASDVDIRIRKNSLIVKCNGRRKK